MASPTGSDINITPTDVSSKIPDKGIDVFFGPDAQSSINDALSKSCKNGASQDCTTEVSKSLESHDVHSLVARVVGVDDIGIAVGVVIAAIIVQLYLEHQASSQHLVLDPIPSLHLEPSDVSALQSVTATRLAIATASGDSKPMSITSAPMPTLTGSSAVITTLTADEGKHRKGDIKISLPSQAAGQLTELLQRTGGHESCGNSSRPRLPAYDTGDRIAWQRMNADLLFILPMAAPFELLRGFGLDIRQNLPRMRGMWRLFNRYPQYY